MAKGTVLILGIGERMRRRRQLNAIALTAKVAGSIVAFQTKREDLRPLEQPCVHTAMRNMAGITAINTNCGMLKNEGPALVDVALHAGFFVLEGMCHHTRASAHAVGRGIGSVGIMAVRALHEAFVDTMLDGHRKLGADVGMTAIAEIGLRFREQLSGSRGLVHGMTVRADNVCSGVRTAANVCPAQLLCVTVQAGIE